MPFFLVTGGAGFIGSRLVNELCNQGYRVRILDNFSTGSLTNLTNLEEIEIVKGDVRNFKVCCRAVKDVDFIFHLAAVASISRSLSQPLICSQVNAGGTINILEAARQSSAARVIVSSSSAVYGHAQNLPNKEDDSLQPLSPYGISKLAAEMYARFYARTYGLETVSLRYFNVFGPGRSPDSVAQSGDVISRFITASLSGKRPIIFGTGKQTRDFIYIENVIRANLLACFSSRVGEGESINIGSGRNISINQLCKLLNPIMNLNIQPEYTTARAGEVRDVRADIEQAGDLIGFKVELDLMEGLHSTYYWYREKMIEQYQHR